MYNSVMIDSKDMVVTVTNHIAMNEAITFNCQGEKKEILAAEPILIYHKVALVDIKKGDDIYKYGQIMGIATQDIKVGTCVHTHNLSSKEI